MGATLTPDGESGERRAAYVALALTPGIGSARLRTLLDACDTPLGALAAPLAFLCGLPGMSRAAATAVRDASPTDGARTLRRIAELGGGCLLPDDEGFPEALRQIPDPPTLLFALGRTSLLAHPTVAIVGSRDHTAYGALVCRQLASAAAERGIAVVSGMARGLDAQAHEAALAAGGGTIGVLGNGLGVVYPAANRALYERVGRDGLLLTEFPPGDRPRVGSFPRRNRLISGLARATVVVEARAGSGALITVEAALAQGREVLAVPGPITSPTSVGTNRLLRDGATPVLAPEDLLLLFPEAYPARRPKAEPPDPVLEALAQPAHLDSVATTLGRPVEEVLARLCELEIAGVVEQRPGRRFARRDPG